GAVLGERGLGLLRAHGLEGALVTGDQQCVSHGFLRLCSVYRYDEREGAKSTASSSPAGARPSRYCARPCGSDWFRPTTASSSCSRTRPPMWRSAPAACRISSSTSPTSATSTSEWSNASAPGTG